MELFWIIIGIIVAVAALVVIVVFVSSYRFDVEREDSLNIDFLKYYKEKLGIG